MIDGKLIDSFLDVSSLSRRREVLTAARAPPARPPGRQLSGRGGDFSASGPSASSVLDQRAVNIPPPLPPFSEPMRATEAVTSLVYCPAGRPVVAVQQSIQQGLRNPPTSPNTLKPTLHDGLSCLLLSSGTASFPSHRARTVHSHAARRPLQSVVAT